MAATTNATIVFYGTAWHDTTLLERAKQRPLELERRDGIRRHFEYDWEVVARYNPAYLRYVEAERQRLGEQHPLFLTQYCLKPIAGGGRLLTPGQLAPGLQVLAEAGGLAELAVLDVGAKNYGGGTAKGRRVKLPWGEAEFDINSLNANGETIMRRAIVWAAAPVRGISGVRITLQVGSDPSGRVDTQVQLLNVPEEP